MDMRVPRRTPTSLERPEPNEQPDENDPEREQRAKEAVEGDPADLPPIGRTAPPVVVPRWIQLVLLPLAILGLWALARAAGSILLILIIASVIALILNPLVKLIERGRIHRGLAIFLVYLAGFGILAGIIVVLADPVSNQVSNFAK